jgi:hypothetical protein
MAVGAAVAAISFGDRCVKPDALSLAWAPFVDAVDSLLHGSSCRDADRVDWRRYVRPHYELREADWDHMWCPPTSYITSSSLRGEIPCYVLKKFYQSSRDRLARAVPTDLIEGFHRFALAALVRCTAPVSSCVEVDGVPGSRRRDCRCAGVSPVGRKRQPPKSQDACRRPHGRLNAVACAKSWRYLLKFE